MSIVYEGYDSALDRTVAIKTIRKDLLESDDGDQMRMRFRREAQTIANLKHENFIAVFELQEDWDPPFMAMEHIRYKNLAQLAKEGFPFTWAHVRDIGLGLLSALTYIHSKALIHRDIKPANLFWEEGQPLKLADFGVAKVSASTLTQHGMTMGTPAYMAPEQFAGQSEDERVDLWAVGVVLYELITRSRCFTGDYDTVRKLVSQGRAMASPKAMERIIGTDLEPVLRKALEPNPKLRFKSAAEFAEALRQMRDPEGTIPPFGIDGEDDAPTVLVKRLIPSPLGAIGEIATKAGAMKKAVPWILGLGLIAVVGILTRNWLGGRIDPEALRQSVKVEDCAELALQVDGGDVTVTGFVPSEESKTQLVKRLMQEKGVERVSARLEIRPWPLCAAVEVIKPVGKAQAGDAGSMHVRVQGYSGQLKDGQQVGFEVKTPAREGYLYVDYYQADRSVVHLVPGPGQPSRKVSAGEDIKLEAGTVSSPYGDELLVVMVSKTPMFTQPRAQFETAEQYLPVLKQEITTQGTRGLIADYVFLKTAP